MSVPNALIATPIRFAATSYVVRVTINGVAENLTFPASGSLTVGRDYWMIADAQADASPGSTNNGEGSVLEMLRATIASHSATGAVTVALTSDFLVLLDLTSDPVFSSINWDHVSTTLDEAIFGFPNAEVPALGVGSCLGTNIPHGLCRLHIPISIDGRPRQPIVRGFARSLTGKSRVSDFVLPYKERELNLDLILQKYALTEYADATNPTGTLEYAWVNSLSLGRYFRLYEDETTTATSTSYSLNTVADLEDALERAAEYRIRWRDTIRMIETEAATS